MKKYFFLLFVLMFALACNLPTANSANPESEAQSQPANSPQPTLILNTPTAIPFTPIPTMLPTVVVFTSTPMTLPQSISSSHVVYFDPGWTWKDIAGYVPANGSVTYRLGASGGQVMAVSVIDGVFPIQIQGRDGAVLCPMFQGEECNFWRGKLPATQDYYVTVSSDTPSNFTMRVAISPVGTPEQTFEYKDSEFSLKYLDQFLPAVPPPSLNNKTNPKFALQLVDTDSYRNTNLSEAYFVLGTSSESSIFASCTEPNQSNEPETSGRNVSVNGREFTATVASGVGAGNIYDQYIYRAAYESTCYEVIFFVHSTNIANYPAGLVTEFDRNLLLMKFNTVFASLQLK